MNTPIQAYIYKPTTIDQIYYPIVNAMIIVSLELQEPAPWPDFPREK